MADCLVAVVRRNAYIDSVTLLQVSAEMLSLVDVLDAALVMATDLNRQLLIDSGLLVGDAQTAGPNDLVIAIRAGQQAAASAAVQHADALLAGRRREWASSGPISCSPPRSLRSAHRADPAANLAVVSVPGPYAAAEARQALADGLHVFLFSDNVSVEDEIDLKRSARSKELLVMGPDCGTAILNGIGLGFANVVRRGRIGLVGASGTGLQEVTSLLHQAGEGISHAIGTGGRDMSAEVGGITTLQAIELLGNNPATEVIVLLGKSPGLGVATRVLSAAANTGKAVVACLPGADIQAPPGVQMARNLYQAARLAASTGTNWAGVVPEDLPRLRLSEQQQQIRGLFCGGTLCQEAAAAVSSSAGHQFVDFGADEYTRGRAHPMIDPTLRNRAIGAVGSDPRVAILLLDLILGLAAHPDPAGATVPAIREALARAAADGRELAVLARVVGTDRDPQGLAGQEATLRSAGVHLPASNYHAAVAASLLLERVAA